MESNYCVYIHTAPNEKRYIGITKQAADRRWRRGHGYRRNKYFYSAIVKHGWDNISHEIYADGLSQKEAEKLEQQLIAKYKSKDRRFGYNHTDGGDGTKGCSLSLETRLKMSLSRKGNNAYWYGKQLTNEARKKISEKHKKLCEDKQVLKTMRDVNPNKKQVYQYTTQGELIQIWESRHQAENEFISGKKSLAIGKCCQGDCASAYGYIWSFTPLKNIKTPLYHRKVYQYHNNGGLIKEWDNLSDAINNFRDGTKSTVISQCVTGHRPTAYGYYWAYSKEESEAV